MLQGSGAVTFHSFDSVLKVRSNRWKLYFFVSTDDKDITDADHSPICVPSIHFYISCLQKSRHESRFMAGKIQIMQTTFEEAERKIITKIANSKNIRSALQFRK